MARREGVCLDGPHGLMASESLTTEITQNHGDARRLPGETRHGSRGFPSPCASVVLRDLRGENPSGGTDTGGLSGQTLNAAPQDGPDRRDFRGKEAGWRLAAPRPVGDPGVFLARLRAEARGAPVALGVDLPLGVPRAYAAHRPEAGFLPFLETLRVRPDFFRVCETLADIHPGRPFYPARGVKGMTRASHAAALGFAGAGDLSRLCDRATPERPAGAPLFWTLGANQTGKAALAAWRDMLLPALAREPPLVRLWPFEGRFRALLAPGTVTLAETYPAEALRHLGIRLRGSKRRQADRAAAAPMLLAAMTRLNVAPEPALVRAVTDGLGGDAAGEDRFDCLLGVLCVINVLAGHRPDDTPDDPWVTSWEGWVLGQTALPVG